MPTFAPLAIAALYSRIISALWSEKGSEQREKKKTSLYGTLSLREGSSLDPSLFG